MNPQQAASIYVRHILAVKTDALIDLIHNDFHSVHNVGIARPDDETIRHAIIAAQNELTIAVTGEQIRHATEQLVERGWRDVIGEALE